VRRITVILMSLGALTAAAGIFASSSPAGGQSEGEGPSEFSFEIIKDVHGDGPTSGYVIEYECLDESGAPLVSDTLNFDNIVDGHETQVVTADTNDFATCTVTEVDSNGADLVEYECEVFFDAGAPEGDAPSCTDGQTATHLHPGTFGSFLVRNTFEADVLPDDEEPPPAVEPDVVAASPSFTG